MLFGEKLRAMRKERGWTQDELAKKIGVSLRTITNYEKCKMYPNQTSIYHIIGDLFGVNIDYLLSNEDYLPHSDKANKRELQALLNEVDALFTDDELDESEKDRFMRTISDLYWHAKEKSRKNEVHSS
jgi:transcriptional regulator with XRE-family HTH domain